MTEQEIVEELKKRWPEPWFERHHAIAECGEWSCFMYISGLTDEYVLLPDGVDVPHEACQSAEALLAAIRSLPVPSEPSREDDSVAALKKFLGEHGAPLDLKMYVATLRDLERQAAASADRDTALRELAEVAKKWHRAPIVEIADEAAHEFEDWLARHSSLLNGEPKKEPTQ